ncbi:MAG: heparinase, partial [Sphingomonadaceae bacterium]|nr:heparinase [Sphingomonadaceae bacterium]
MNDLSNPFFQDDKQEPDGIETGKRLIRLSSDQGSSLTERIANQFYRLTWRTPLHNMRLKGKYPLKLLAVPQDKVAGDARAGKAIRAGHFLFRGQKMPLADMDFATPMAAPQAEYLHGFRWLRDLATNTTREQGAPIAEAITRRWLSAHAEKPSEPAWAPENAGWRLIFWAAYAPYILSSNDLIYRSLVLTSFARTARHLDRSADKAPIGLPRLVGWGGIVAAGLLLPGGAPRRAFAEAGLKRALESALYSDGGIVSRSPTDLLRTVDLLGLLNTAYDAVREETPSFITETLARTVAALLGITHGDGGLASWQGAGATEAAQVERVVQASGVRTRPLR